MDGFTSIPAPFPTAPPQSHVDDEMVDDKAKSEEECRRDSEDRDDKGRWDTADSMSDISDTEHSAAQRLAMALSCKDEGTRLLKESQLAAACSMYEDGLKKLKHVAADDDVKESDIRNAQLALNLNLSLCYNRQSQWSSSIKCATAALSIDSTNVKGLFRRGVARSREGFLDEARGDLLRVCQLDKANKEARLELQLVNEKAAEARARDRKAFGGLFSKSAGLYDDREKEVQAQKRKEAAARESEMKQYEEENKALEEKGATPYASFDAWKKERTETPKSTPPTDTPTQSSAKKIQSQSAVSTDDLDEEDKQIMEETKKMGYCYFNRSVAPEAKETYAVKAQPVRVDDSKTASLEASIEEEAAQRSLSSWNNRGTTYEEKDCSSWACKSVRRLLTDVSVKNDLTDNPAKLQDALSSVMEPQNAAGSTEALAQMAGKLLPFTCKVTAVDTVEGEAQVVVLRASKRYLYDLKIVLSFTLSIPDVLDKDKPQTTYSGTLQLADVSSASSVRPVSTSTLKPELQTDWLMDAKVLLKKGVTIHAMHQPVWDNAVLMLKEAVYNAVKAFEAEFKAHA